jgi:hypothetical protein
MADVLVESPANAVPPHKRAAPSTIPTIDNFEGAATETGDEYATLKKLQRQLEYIQLQEEYIKDEQRWVGRQEGEDARTKDAVVETGTHHDGENHHSGNDMAATAAAVFFFVLSIPSLPGTARSLTGAGVSSASS